MPEAPTLDGQMHDLLWQHAPWRLYRSLRTWRPLEVGDRTFKFPVLGGRHIPFELLRDGWRREVFAGLMPQDGSGFVDVGVNLGHTLIDLQCAAPMSRYVGFEPNVACVDYVNELLRLNHITDWHVVPAALTGANRVLKLWLREGAETDEMATVIAGLRPEEKVTAQYVAGLTFDDVRQDVLPGPVRFVKIDVEGAELAVLQGMRATLASDRPMVLCEVLFTAPGGDMEEQRARNEALQRSLAEQGYIILQVIKTKMGDLVGGSRIREFPQAFWSPQNKHQCDYLFAPAEDLRRAAKMLY